MSTYNPRTVTPGTLRNQNYLKTKIENSAGEYRESVKKWQRDHNGRTDGIKMNLWKSWSKIRRPSDTFREQFDDICWCSEIVSPRCRRHSNATGR